LEPEVDLRLSPIKAPSLPSYAKRKRNGALPVDRRSWFHIDYLQYSPLEEHGLRVIELAVIDSYFMVLVANNLEVELSITRIPACSLSSYIVSIQEYLISLHALRNYGRRSIAHC